MLRVCSLSLSRCAPNYSANMSESVAIISLAILVVCSAVTHDQWEENGSRADTLSPEEIYDRVHTKLEAVQDEINSHSSTKSLWGGVKCPGKCADLGCTGGIDYDALKENIVNGAKALKSAYDKSHPKKLVDVGKKWKPMKIGNGCNMFKVGALCMLTCDGQCCSGK